MNGKFCLKSQINSLFIQQNINVFIFFSTKSKTVESDIDKLHLEISQLTTERDQLVRQLEKSQVGGRRWSSSLIRVRWEGSAGKATGEESGRREQLVRQQEKSRKQLVRQLEKSQVGGRSW